MPSDFNLYDLSSEIVFSSGSVAIAFATSGQSADTVTQNASQNTVTLNIGAVAASAIPLSQVGGVAEDWYLFDTNLSIASSKGYVHDDSKHRGPYLVDVSLTFSPTSQPDVLLYQESPNTYQGQTNYTNGITGSLSGSVGFFGEDPTASLSGGVSFSKSVSYSVPDLMIEDQSASQVPKWQFQLAGSHESGPSDIDASLSQPSQVSFNTLEAEVLWVWHAPQSQRAGSDFEFLAQIVCTYEYRWVDFSGAKTERQTSQPMSFPVKVTFPPAPAAPPSPSYS